MRPYFLFSFAFHRQLTLSTSPGVELSGVHHPEEGHGDRDDCDGDEEDVHLVWSGLQSTAVWAV